MLVCKQWTIYDIIFVEKNRIRISEEEQQHTIAYIRNFECVHNSWSIEVYMVVLGIAMIVKKEVIKIGQVVFYMPNVK